MGGVCLAPSQCETKRATPKFNIYITDHIVGHKLEEFAPPLTLARHARSESAAINDIVVASR